MQIGTEELIKVLSYYNLYNGEKESFKILCPFHKDINPSLLVNMETGSWYCFGCNLGGDAYEFVRNTEKGLDDLKIWLKYFTILKSKESLELNLVNLKGKHYKSSSYSYLKEAKDYYYNLKSVNWYKERSEESKYLKKRGFKSSALNTAEAKLTYNKSYPIIFPMYDMEDFKGWVCRTTSQAIERKRKYLYNKGFSRANTLVGFYDADTVMIVEGFMDYLKAVQLGITNVVAILGWKISNQQIKKLKRMQVRTIISALDNDDCGKRGTEYLANHFKNVLRFPYPQEIKDIGDLNKTQYIKIKENLEELKWV